MMPGASPTSAWALKTARALLRSCVALIVGACALPAARAAGAPVDVTLRALHEQMKFDLKEFKVPVGSHVRLHFKNEDAMQHNVLICLPREMCEAGSTEDNAMEVAMAAWALGGEGPEHEWIPKHPRVFAHSSMLDGGHEELIEFDAPARPGRYPFICSFPGHAMMMFGTMNVQQVVPGLTDVRYTIFRTGALTAFPKDFDALRSHVIATGGVADGLIDAAPVAIADHYAMEFTGTLNFPQDGSYTFSLAGDKGTQLFIDGGMAVDQRIGHSARAIKNGTVAVKSGDHRITFRYWHQLGEDPELSLVWKGPGFGERALSRIDLVERKRQNDGDLLEGMMLAPSHGEPVFYHNFLADLPEGGFAVGFPGGANLSWDPRNLNISTVWAGDFLNVKAHRTSRGAGAIKPAGFDAVLPAPGPAFAPVIDASGAPITPRFIGYHFDAARRPTFRQRLGTVEVAESYASSGNLASNDMTLTRTLEFHGEPPAAGLKLRVAAGGSSVSIGPAGCVLDGVVSITVHGATLQTASVKTGSEVLAPIVFSGGEAHVVIQYRWLSTAGKASPAMHHAPPDFKT